MTEHRPPPKPKSISVSDGAALSTPVRVQKRMGPNRPIAFKDGLKCPSAATWCPTVEAKDTKVSFEAALGQLEAIVESMESGEVPLAELLAKFEEGSKLLKICEARLKEAE